MTRRPDWIPARKAFPKNVQVAILKRSGGMCERDGCVRVGKEFDHYPKPQALGGPSTLENGRLLCRECNQETGVETAQAIAKADRQAGRSGQYARRQKAKAEGRYHGIKSRGFDKSRKRKLPTRSDRERILRGEK